MECQIVKVGTKKLLQIGGNVFYKHSQNLKNEKTVYWRCQQCNSRATTKLIANDVVELKKGMQ